MGDGDFKFSIPDTDEKYSYYGQNSSVVRMGDVCYPLPYWARAEFENNSVNGNLIISVPVGSLTLALSREAIEDTDSNRKLIVRAGEALSKEQEASKSNIKIDWAGINHGRSFSKDIFKWGLWALGLPFNKVSNITVGSGGKTYLVWIPNNRASDAWRSKLRDWAIADDKNSYYYFTQTEYPRDERLARLNEVDGDFELISIKKLRTDLLKSSPTLVKSVSEYVMFPPNSTYKDKYSIEGFKESNPDIPNLDEVKTLSELNKFSVLSNRASSYCGWSSPMWRVPAARARLALIDYGMFDYDAPEVSDRRKEFEEEQKEAHSRQTAIGDVLGNGVDVYTPISRLRELRYKSRTEEQEARIAKRCFKIKQMIETIKKEDSPRAEVLQQMSYSRKLSRGTLRRVLSLK